MSVLLFSLFCCDLFLQNKPDLELLPFLLVVCAAALAAGVPVAGTKERTGSEVSLVPVLQIGPLRSLCVGGHHGGGDVVERWWRSSEGRFAASSSSSTLSDRRWRLLMLLAFPGHGVGGGWPTSSLSPVNLLVEWQPNIFLPATKPKGRQYCVRMVAKVSGLGSFAAPSGHGPRRRRSANCASTEDPIAFLFLRWRSFMQSLGACLYFLVSSGCACNMCSCF